MQWIADALLTLTSPGGLLIVAAIAAGIFFARVLRHRLRLERFAASPIRRHPELLCAIAAFAIYASAGLLRMPVPIIHDEHANLLAADTFRHGRLSNPPHPHWRHFENFHVLQQPTYASKFPPATGIALAIGMILGHAAIGMWLVIAAAAAALVWMLRAWFKPSWAFLGALLTVSHPLVFAWGESYWGGALALLGSALFLGGIAHLRLHGRGQFAAAAGLAILLCSRPYEGGALALVVFLVTIRRRTLKPLAIACTMIVTPAALFLVYANWRITGDPFLLPYVQYERQYNPAPLFVWQQPHAIPAAPDTPLEMRRYYDSLAVRAQSQRTLSGWMNATFEKLRSIRFDLFAFSRESLQWLPAVILIAIPIRNRDTRRMASIAILTLAAILCVTWYAPYYLAVLVPILTFLWIGSLRRMRAIRIFRRPAGLLWSRLLIIVWFVAFAFELRNREHVPAMWQSAMTRERIQRELERSPGRDLVFVEHGPRHFVHVSWIYNAADIDASEVVWARSLTPAQNRNLAAYYAERNVWRIDPAADGRPHRVR